MSLWFVLALMTAGAVFSVLWPLGGRASPDVGGSEAAVYKDQLAEIERDRASDLIGVPEAEAARVEIGRRLIAVSDPEKRVAPSSNIVLHRVLAIVALRRSSGWHRSQHI